MACKPRKARTLAAIRAGSNKLPKPQVDGYSEALALTFKPGVPLWRQLALEAAAEKRWRK